MFKSFSIATKIGLALSILVIGYSFSMLFGYDSVNKIESRVFYVSECLYPASFHSQDCLVAFDKLNSLYYDAVLIGEESFIDDAEKQTTIAVAALQKVIDLKGLKKTEKEKIVTFSNNLENYSKKAKKIYTGYILDAENSDVVSAEEQKQISEVNSALTNESGKLRDELKKISLDYSERLKRELGSISQQTRNQQHLNMVICFVVVFISLGFVWWIIRRAVSTPLKKTVTIISDIASGDLTREFHSDMKDEVGQIIEALNTMVVSLKEVLHLVAETTKKTSTASLEISAAVEEQAAVTSEQSSSVSEITATMEELSITTTQVAEYSNAVAGIAIESLENTKTGAESVELVMNKMNEINVDNQKNIRDIIDLGKKSEEINKVMVIINNIADQTKLIAFNAALEASSAGEAGKRFGVVAAEIRRLADSVIVSTGETENKIKEIQDAVNNMVIASEKSSKGIRDGLEYSTDTAVKLNEIVIGAQETADAAKQISLSTQQELSATEQVLTALKEIEQGAKQAASSIGQIGFISKDLENLSRDLTELIGKFKLKIEKK